LRRDPLAGDLALRRRRFFRRSAPEVTTFDVALELGRGETLSSPQLPGFELALDELFRD
jgi:hypothetical protein